ncbi:histone-like nucleoid-structuring protein Lsr2 [Streptomyces cyaneofuscatus]|uniref:Lsr2 family DNA-binding protein n=1 Tax=Streptomyces cyaneofuscatus TaxID=66883 RepID=UPI00365BC600
MKAGTRTRGAAPTGARTGSGSGRTREELAAIRSWARENGHQVADLGMVPKRVLEAYDAAHQDSARKAGLPHGHRTDSPGRLPGGSHRARRPARQHGPVPYHGLPHR